MDVNEKRKLIQKLLEETENVRINKPSASRANPLLPSEESSQAYVHIDEALEKMGDIKYNYYDYLTGNLSLSEELKRIPTADYELCTAILTTILREDYFSFGSFEPRVWNGDVTLVLERMLEVLE